MAAKSLTLNEMAHVTANLLHPESPAYARLRTLPLLGQLIPLLEAAHSGVVEVAPPPDNPALKELSALATATDAVYDSLGRAVWDVLTAASLLGDDGSPYLEVRDAMLPEGVAAATQITYEGEAGFVQRLRARLTEPMRQQLSGIRVGERDLLGVVESWLDAGDRLGDLEQQKVRATVQRPSVNTILEARLAWIRSINALRHLAPLAQLSDEDEQAIFGTLDDLEARADQRAARRKASSIETDVAEEVEAEGSGGAGSPES